MRIRNKYKQEKSDQSDSSDRSDKHDLRTASAETAANTMICLVNQASYLLGRQLRQLEQGFKDEGGFSERLYRARVQTRRERRG